MRVGALVTFGLVAGLAATQAALADGIVRIVNASDSAVTVRMDGTYGCRAPAKLAAPSDIDMPNQCSFGATNGNHTLEFDYDNGKSAKKAVSIGASGVTLTLPGDE
jgi:hypothetical protein